MKHSIGKSGLIALAIVVAAGVAHASVQNAEAAAKTTASSQGGTAATAGKDSKPKAAAVKLVDINSASKAELKSLPGIDDARAEKIIKGRPYLSKAFLVDRKIIPIGVYEQIKKQIIAKQN